MDEEQSNSAQSTNIIPRVDFSEFPATNYDQWKEAAIAALKGASFEKSMYTQTYEGITLEPLYTLDHVKDIPAARSLPTQRPMLRGADASGYLGRLWEIVQPSDAYVPQEANRIAHYEVDKGATTVAFRLNAATLRGEDVGDGVSADVNGASVSTLEDFEALFEGFDLVKHPLHIHCGASAAPMLGFLLAVAERRGTSPEDLYGCIGGDPIGCYAEEGKTFCNLGQLYDEMAHTIHFTEKKAPRLRTALIRGDVYHNGGANAVQEVAYVMAAAVELAHEMAMRHIDIDLFARHLRFEFSLGANFFMEIAKVRAARVVWARIAESCGGGEEACRANIFGRTSLFTKTVYDPYVNMLRNTTEAFSGVVGGLDGITVGPFDEAVRSADEFSRRVSRNAQIMLQDEYHLVQPVDPAGGSWYLESLTDTLAGKIWALIQEIESEGGILTFLRSGKAQNSIEGVLKDRFQKLAKRSDRAVGTNMYPNTIEQPLETRAADATAMVRERADAVARFREKRSLVDVEIALKPITENNLENGELVEAIAKAASTGATLGELRKVLSDDDRGEPEIAPILPRRWTEQFEEMRQRTEKFQGATGDNVRIFLSNMGPIPQHKARADFITGFMEVANFEVLKNDGFPTVEECAEATVSSGADIAVICSTDATYPELVPPLAKLIKEKKPAMKVFLAGAPAEEHKQSYIDAGVDDFINVRSNCLAVLTDLQKAKGMF